LPAETLTAEIAEILVHPPAILRIGVSPTGAQVFLTVGTRQNPLSSRKTRGILSLSDFFYMRPDMALPPFYFLFIPLSGFGFGLLAAPAQILQNLPDMRRVIGDIKAIIYHLGDSL